MNILLNPPPNGVNKDKIQNLVQRLRILQSQGFKEDNNPEYAQIMQYLKTLQTQPRGIMTDPFINTPPSAPSPNSAGPGVEIPSAFTGNQLAALRYQILAYKSISKNLALPLSLQQAILHPSSAGSPDLPAPQNPTLPESNIPEFNAYASPYDLLKTPITSFVHASRQQRFLIPSITPIGLDPHDIISEREKRRFNRMEYRASQLKPNSLHRTIELKSLKLVQKQRQLRQEIIKGICRATTLAPFPHRMKKPSLRDARMTEKIERQQRIDREDRERQHHLEYLQTICDHSRQLLSGRSRQNKLGKAVLQYHQHLEKEEQKRAERISKERIRALRNDDEEAYMKLIDEAKDTRLTQLLRQTGVFLNSLTKAVQEQQNEGREPGVDDDDNDLGDVDAKNDYFQVTHRIKEEVVQPNILVGGQLKDYQIKGLQWMVSLYNNHLNGILADEMGLGKTIQTISLITYLIERKRQNGPFLIIVPLSTLTNWTLEFEKWAPAVKKVVYKGTPNIRRELQNELKYQDFHVVLTTFEYIIKDRPVLSKIKWLHMIVDEGHRMKNTNSKLTIVLRQYYHTRYRLILTGTPLQNNLPELWALLNFILPKIFKSVKSFEEWFNTPFNTQGVQDKIGLNEEEQLLIIKRLHKVLRPFLLRRLKRDVEAELPDKVEKVIKCKLSSLQTHLYTQMKRNGTLYTAETIQKGKSGVKGLNNTIMQLRKICNHPFVFEEVEHLVNPSGMSNDLLFRTSGKFELLDRMLPKLKQTGHRVLIFFQMTQVMSIMEDFLNYRGFQYMRLDGSTKADDRSDMLKKFNAPNSPYFIFLLSTRAGGLGLNLQTADTVIIFDSDWNPHQDLQAQDRAHRIGQTKEVRIFRLVSSNSVEERILARAQYKLDIDGKVIQAGKFDNRSTEEDREAFLRSLLEDKQDEEEEEDVDQDRIDDEELNDLLQRDESDLDIFHRIDDEREERDLLQWKAMGRRGKPERLITDSELPSIYLNDDPLPDFDDDPDSLGRGQRSRDHVRYDDGLTEEQWLNALEDDNVDLDELIERKERRKQKRIARLTGEPEPEEVKKAGRRKKEEMYQDDANGKKRGRPKKETEFKRKRGKNEDLNRPDTLTPQIREAMTRVFEACYTEVVEAVEEDEESYRSRSELFMDLVSKKEYPIYYTMIKQPISLNMIYKRIHSTYYKTVAQFRDDFLLMFNNARIFNEEGSIVYEDANEMEKLFELKLNELCPGGVLPVNNQPTFQPNRSKKDMFENYLDQDGDDY